MANPGGYVASSAAENSNVGTGVNFGTFWRGGDWTTIFVYRESQAFSGTATWGGVDIQPYLVDTQSSGARGAALYIVPKSALTSLTIGTSYTLQVGFTGSSGFIVTKAEYNGQSVMSYDIPAIATGTSFSDSLSVPAGSVVVQHYMFQQGGDAEPSNGQTERQDVESGWDWGTGDTTYTSASGSVSLGYTSGGGSVVHAHCYIVILGTPELVSVSPADNATGVAASASLVAVFDKPIVRGAGEFELYDGGGLIEAIEAASGTLSTTTWVDDTITLNPTSDMAGGTAHYVLVDSDAITGFAGIASSTAWSFTTESAVLAEPLGIAQRSLLGTPLSTMPVGMTTRQLLGSPFFVQPLGLLHGPQLLSTPISAQPQGIIQRTVLDKARVMFLDDGGQASGPSPKFGIGIKRRM